MSVANDHSAIIRGIKPALRGLTTLPDKPEALYSKHFRGTKTQFKTDNCILLLVTKGLIKHCNGI